MDQICDGRDIEPDREERGPPRKSSKRGRSQIDPEHTAFAFTRFGDDIQDVFLRIARGTLLSDWSIWGVTYIVVGYEACPATARHHLQGYLQTEQPIQVSTIRDKLPGYSIDVAKSTLKNNFDYCTGNHTGKEPYKKYESSDEGPINVGTFTESGVSRHIDGYRHTKPSKQGARRDLEEVYNAISEDTNTETTEDRVYEREFTRMATRMLTEFGYSEQEANQCLVEPYWWRGQELDGQILDGIEELFDDRGWSRKESRPCTCSWCATYFGLMRISPGCCLRRHTVNRDRRSNDS